MKKFFKSVSGKVVAFFQNPVVKGVLGKIVFLVAVYGIVTTGQVRNAGATYRSISILKSPQAQLTLPANTVTTIPGTYCTVIVYNPAANPVYWGGPTAAGVANVVNATGSLAICNNAALCKDDILTVNVNTGGIALLSTVLTTVKYTVGEGCNP